LYGRAKNVRNRTTRCNPQLDMTSKREHEIRQRVPCLGQSARARIDRMSLREQTAAARVLEARARYVARGVTTPRLVVAGAEGARLEDVDGRTYIDFAGGIGCQNTGHRAETVAAAIHEQVDRYLHQCFMVGTYEPYVDVCRRLAEVWPGPRSDVKSILLNSGAEAVENAVKIARAATGRPAVVVFENGFHGRTLLTLTMTSKLVYRRGFGPFAPEVHHVPAPYPYRGIGSDDALAALERLFHSHVDPQSVACVVLEPVQGEGGFIPMPPDFPARLAEVCERHGILYVDDEVQSGVGRTGPVWAIEHYGVEPDLIVSGKSLGGGLPLAGVTGRSELMDAVAPGGLGGTFGGNPVACAAALAVLDEIEQPAFRARADEIGARIRTRLDAIAARHDQVGEVRGLGPMLALELVRSREGREPAGELAQATVAEALDRGLVLLSCGLDGNVVRILVPLVVSDEDLDRGLDLLEESLGAAAGAN
jgi:4-aminobutyrate aminotransferase